MAPLVCPLPGPRNPGPDCQLWSARERIRFRRLLEIDHASRLGLGDLVWADFNRSYRRPPVPPTRPLPPGSQPISSTSRMKGAEHA